MYKTCIKDSNKPNEIWKIPPLCLQFDIMFTVWVSDSSRLQFLAWRCILRPTIKAGKWLRSVLLHILLFAVKQSPRIFGSTVYLQCRKSNKIMFTHTHKNASRRMWLGGWEAAAICMQPSSFSGMKSHIWPTGTWLGWSKSLMFCGGSSKASAGQRVSHLSPALWPTVQAKPFEL